MTSFLLLLVLWPHKHHTPPPAPPPPVIDPLESPVAGHPCEMMYGVFAYWGEDGVIGFGRTCEYAYQNWKQLPSPHLPMNMI